MKGRHVSFCCSSYKKPQSNRAHPLEIESYKKQLSEAYATLHFLMKKRVVHSTPQTEMELARTNQLIQKLLDVLKPNQVTPSIPQERATQTEGLRERPPISEFDATDETSTERSSASTEDSKDPTYSAASESYIQAGQDIAYTYLYFQNPSQDLEALAKRVEFMSQRELDRYADLAMKSDFEPQIKDISAEIKQKEPQSYEELVRDLNILLTNR